MKYHLLASFIAVLLVTCQASPAAAQGMQMSPEQRTQRLKDSLALNDTQTKQVLKIYTEMDTRRQELFSSGPEDRDARMAAMRSLRDSTDVKIEALLTPTQKVKFDELKKRRAQRGQGMRPDSVSVAK
jgi:protein CpxP